MSPSMALAQNFQMTTLLRNSYETNFHGFITWMVKNEKKNTMKNE